MLQELRQLITDSFSESELRALSFDLGIDYDEELRGPLKLDKVVSLLQLCQRTNRGEELVALCRSSRPDVTWPDWNNTKSKHFGTDVLKSKQKASSADLYTTHHTRELPAKLDEVIEEVVRYLMSKPPEFNPNWFVRRREIMETSYTVISSATEHLDLLVSVPYISRDTIESCHQLSLQALDLMQLLQKINIGPDSPRPKRELHNNLYLIDERATETARKLEQLMDSYYAGHSPGTISSELQMNLNQLKSSTEYTLLWLNRAIEKLDRASSSH